jgi:hypothetical protein
MSMRIIRILHAGSFPIALALAMTGLGGGCDNTTSNAPTVIKEDPKEAADRAKHISEQYKSNPPAQPKGPGAPGAPGASTDKKH